MQSGLRAWQRVARLLARSEKLTAAAGLVDRLLQLASGRPPPPMEPESSPKSVKTGDSLGDIWLPLPLSAPGASEIPTIPENVIYAPGAVAELLVLQAEVQVSLGHPMRALRLCKWARHYARDTHVELGAAFAEASILASQILAECPELLALAQIDDGKVCSSWQDSQEVVISADATEADAETRAQIIVTLRKDALKHSCRITMDSETAELTHTPIQNLPRNLPDGSGSQADRHKLNKTNRNVALSAEADYYVRLELPVLHHLKDCEDIGVSARDTLRSNTSLANLYEIGAQRRTALLLDLAEALQHQTSSTAEYQNLVALAGKQVAHLAEPSPSLCVRVWLHQLRGLRLELEGQLESGQSVGCFLRIGGSEDQHPASSPHKILAVQLSGYFRLVMLVAAFVDTYCGNNLRLQRALFSEGLMLSVQLLAFLPQFLLETTASQGASSSSSLNDCIGMFKKAAFGGAQLCMLALCLLEQHRQQTSWMEKRPELDAPLDSLRFHKPCVRLFQAFQSSYFAAKNADETISEGIEEVRAHMSASSFSVLTPKMYRAASVLPAQIISPAGRQYAWCKRPSVAVRHKTTAFRTINKWPAACIIFFMQICQVCNFSLVCPHT